MKLIAHRGFSSSYPENTLLAFAKAIEVGVDGIETDLRLTIDGEIVLFHDDNLKRLTCKDSDVESMSLNELKVLHVNGVEKITTLKELLELVDEKATLILEVKYNPKTYVNLCRVLEKNIRDKLSWVEVSCFDDEVLDEMHKLNPDIKLHKLIENENILKDKELEKKYAYVYYFDIDVNLREIAMNLGIIERNRVIFWTVEDEDLSKEVQSGLYGVMKNNPIK